MKTRSDGLLHRRRIIILCIYRLTGLPCVSKHSSTVSIDFSVRVNARRRLVPSSANCKFRGQPVRQARIDAHLGCPFSFRLPDLAVGVQNCHAHAQLRLTMGFVWAPEDVDTHAE